MSNLLLGEVLECKINSSNLQDRYVVAVQCRETVVRRGKISAPCSLFLQTGLLDWTNGLEFQCTKTFLTRSTSLYSCILHYLGLLFSDLEHIIEPSNIEVPALES